MELKSVLKYTHLLLKKKKIKLYETYINAFKSKTYSRTLLFEVDSFQDTFHL